MSECVLFTCVTETEQVSVHALVCVCVCVRLCVCVRACVCLAYKIRPNHTGFALTSNLSVKINV